MSIELNDAVRDAGDRLLSIRGAVLLVTFAVLQVADLVVHRTALAGVIRWVVDNYGLTVSRLLGHDVAPSDVSVADLRMELVERGLLGLASWLDEIMSAGLDVPLWLALLLAVLLPLVAELLHVLAVRAVAVTGDDSLREAMFDDLGRVYLRSLVANSIAVLLIAVGLVLLVVPGAVAALVFLFVRQRVVLSGDGVTEALGNSYAVVRTNLRPVLGLFALLLLLGLLTIGASALPGPAWIPRLVTGLFVVFGVLLTTMAYLQADLEAESQTSASATDTDETAAA